MKGITIQKTLKIKQTKNIQTRKKVYSQNTSNSNKIRQTKTHSNVLKNRHIEGVAAHIHNRKKEL